MKQVRFFDLPLGTRFSYPDFPNVVWVILSHADCGLVARWEGANADKVFQSICSFAETETECREQTVIVREEPDFTDLEAQGCIY